MPSTKTPAIEEAVREHIAGTVDAEGRSPIDILAIEIGGDANAVEEWGGALTELVRETREVSGDWWDAIQFLATTLRV
jgi:hypothetical protein